MSIKMSYWAAKLYVKIFGWSAFLAMMQKRFPDLNLYKVSQSWFFDGAQYICKLKGTYGDVIITWLTR
jgi:hypothetical protein